MARPIWKGHISFGLVNVPVVLFSAERRTDLQFNLLDSRNHARIRYERVNEVTGEEVPWRDVVKGYEYDDGSYVLLDEEDFKRAAVEATQTVEIKAFVDKDAIDHVYFDRPYYLLPGKKGEKGYVLLRETLKRSKKVGIAKVVIRARQHLAALIPMEHALVLDLLRFAQELRGFEDFEFPSGSLKEYKVSTQEIELGRKLIEAMTADWEPEQYHDEYRDALMKWIDKKIESGEIEPAAPAGEEEEEEGPDIINLTEQLKKSVAQSKKGKRTTSTKAKRKKKATNHRKTA